MNNKIENYFSNTLPKRIKNIFRTNEDYSTSFLTEKRLGRKQCLSTNKLTVSIICNWKNI